MNQPLVVCIALAVAVSGCRSDGTNGAKNKVRFSLMFDFQETQGFGAPVVADGTILIKLQHPDAVVQVTEPPGFPELTLTAKPIDHGGAATILGLGFSQYALQLNEPGKWELTAKDGDTELDYLELNAERADHLRFGANALVTATIRDGVKTCAEAASVKLDDVLLRPNNSVTYYAVPAREDDSPLIGMLPMAAHASSNIVTLDIPWLLETSTPNGLEVKPSGTLGDEVTIDVTATNAPSFSQRLKTSTQEQTGTCQ